MDNLLRKAVENRKQNLIKKLITFDIYKVNHKHLFELSLSELENEYNSMKKDSHPHSGYNSFQFVSPDNKTDNS